MNAPLFRKAIVGLLLVLVCSFHHGVQAQSGRATADSLKQVVKELRSQMIEADSAQSTAAIGIRTELAALVKRPEAIQLLQEAAAHAGESGLRDEEIAVRTRLAEEFLASGKAASAYTESVLIRTLVQERAAYNAASTAEQHALVQELHVAQVDSVQRLLDEERRVAQVASEAASDRNTFWMWTAAMIGLLWVVSLVFLFQRTGGAIKRANAKIIAISGELAALKELQANSFREVIKAAPRPVATEPVVAGALDPVLVAMFRKSAPERLATLQAARERGDLDKVVRVVHTLKPQLVGMAPDKFAPICAFITAPENRADPIKWNVSVDAFQQETTSLLAGLTD